MPAPARLLIQTIRDVTIVNFQDASILDTAQIEQIGEQLYDLVDGRARRKIVLDFTKVRFLSSSALGILITLRKKADAIKGQIALCALREEIREVFKITKLEKVFKIYGNEDEALLSFGVTAAG
jgi:anti-sigma B factor antagonist